MWLNSALSREVSPPWRMNLFKSFTKKGLMSQLDSRFPVQVVRHPEVAQLAKKILGMSPSGSAQGSQRNWEKDWIKPVAAGASGLVQSDTGGE